MINVSTEFKQKLNSDSRTYLCKANIVLTDGTILDLENDKIMLSTGFSVENVVSQDTSFTALGSVIVDSATLAIYNNDDYYSDYIFEDAKVTLSVGLELSNTTEYVKKGTFIVNQANYGDSVITLNLFDNLIKFDKSYKESNLVYPATLLNIVNNACTVCGVSLASNSLNFPHNSYIVQQAPNSESTTFREVLGWVATIAGCFLRCNTDGELEFAWFDIESLVTETSSLDGGEFDSDSPYSTGDSADGGTFNPWTEGDNVDGGMFTSNSNVHYITQLFSQRFAVDDIVITGVKIIVENTVQEVNTESETSETTTNETEEPTTLEYLFGTTGYIIEIRDNPFITKDSVNTIGAWLQTLLVGTTFRPCELSSTSTPIIESGDVALSWDKKGDMHPILITRVTFNPNSPQTIVCGAESPTKNSSAQLTEATKSYLETAKKIKQTNTTMDNAFKELSQRITNAGGLYATSVAQQGGGYITYYHNKPNLNESDIQLVISDVGITVTSNGTSPNPTWYGLTVDGKLIASIMNTIGINFDWGVGGELTIKNSNNEETLYVNADTGAVRIKATTFALTDGTTLSGVLTDANNYTDTTLGDYETQVTAALQDLQDQIDGVVDTYYYAYAPTLNNYPTNSWAVADYPSHEGDMFLDTSTGKSYRWVQENNVWQWKEIPDTASAQALQTANEAKDIADGKRRIFTAQPYPPYDKGDLWVQGANGDIKVCNTTRATGSYVANDWVIASKYTDDSAFNAFRNGTYATFVTSTDSRISAAQNTANSRITTFYQTSAPTANTIGDLWIDTDDGNKLYRWNGSGWVNIQDTEIQNAIEAAGDAQSTADSKIITFAQPSTPTATGIGDLWIDTDDGNKLYRWNGTSWIAYTDTSALNAFITNTYNTDKINTQEQIDRKIETWHSATDPSTAWTTSALKTAHEGDLWYKTTDQTTWFYSTAHTWIQQNVPQEVFNTIEEKAQIFISTPVPPYNVGDLWFNSATSDILTCIVARASGNYTTTDWQKRNKYTDDKAVTDLDNSLNQQNIFNRLTNNGVTQGIYLENGKIYINGEYIRVGDISVIGRTDAGYSWTEISPGYMYYKSNDAEYGDLTHLTFEAANDGRGRGIGRIKFGDMPDDNSRCYIDGMYSSDINGGHLELSAEQIDINGDAVYISSDGDYIYLMNNVEVDGWLSSSNNIISRSNMSVNVNPSTNQYEHGFYIQDRDSNEWGCLRAVKFTDGRQGVQLEAQRTVNGSRLYNTLNIGLDTSGNKFISLSDPAAWKSALGIGTYHSNYASTTCPGGIGTGSFVYDNYTFGASITIPAGVYVVDGWWTFGSGKTSGVRVTQIAIVNYTDSTELMTERIVLPNQAWERMTIAGAFVLTKSTNLRIAGLDTIGYTSAGATAIRAVRIA